MPTKAQDLAAKQVKDLRLAERHAIKLVGSFGRAVRTKAVASILSNRSTAGPVTQAYIKPLTQGLVFGHLLGQKRAYLNAGVRPKTIALGLYEDTIKTYDRVDPKYLEFIILKYSKYLGSTLS